MDDDRGRGLLGRRLVTGPTRPRRATHSRGPAPSPGRPVPCHERLFDFGRFAYTSRRDAPGPADRSRCPRTQPQGRDGRVPARPSRGDHRTLRQRQEQPRVRHDLRRGPASLRREPERLCPPVPRPDGEAGRRPDRRPVAGHLDRPEGRVAQPAVDGRHGHRDLRPPPPAVRPDRHPALPQRPSDRAPERPADRRPGAGAAGGHAAPRPRPAHQGPQDRGRPGLRGRPAAGLRPRPGRRGDVRPLGGADARQVQAPLDRGRRRPLRRPPGRGAGRREAGRARPAHRPGDRARGPGPGRVTPGRLDRDRAPARRGCRPDRAGRSRRRGGDLRGAPLQRALHLSVRRHDDRRPRAAELLVQLAPRRLPVVHRSRDAPRDRRGPGDPGPLEEPRQGRARAVGKDAERCLVAVEDPRGDHLVPRLGLPRPGPRPAEGGDRVRPVRREGREGPRPLQARARREHVQGDVRGDRHEPRAALPRDGLGVHQDRAREVHGHAAVPDVWRQAPEARDPRRHGRRTEHLGDLGDVDHRGPRLGGRTAEDAVGSGADDRLPAPQGDHRPARVPRRRRSRLPGPRPGLGDAVGRRGPADPARDPDRDDADGRALHPRRAVDRPPPAGQREADRDADAAARPREHRARRRARRGDDPDGRLGDRHRARGGGARRRDHRERDARVGPRRAAVHHRRVPARRPCRADPAEAAQGQRQEARRERRTGAQPPQGRPGDPARDVHRGDRRIGERQEHARDGRPLPGARSRAERFARAGRRA